MGKLAFLFSGQGAQYEGMGQELAACSPAARTVFDAADAIRPGTSAECFEASKTELSQTRITQPTVFCTDLAAGEALREKGIEPDFAAGFSLGEIPALVFCGYLTLDEAFRFVVWRGEIMEKCASENPGEMYAVMRLGAKKIEELAALFDGVFSVNYNSEEQIVVACAIGVGEEFAAAVKDAGGRALKLAVSGAFHSPFMDAASGELAREFGGLSFSEPRIVCVSNITALPYSGEELLFRQVNSPVLWQKTIEYLCAQGVNCFVECGPGKVLTGLVKKITPEAVTVNVENEETLNCALEVLKSVE